MVDLLLSDAGWSVWQVVAYGTFWYVFGMISRGKANEKQ